MHIKKSNRILAILLVLAVVLAGSCSGTDHPADPPSEESKDPPVVPPLPEDEKTDDTQDAAFAGYSLMAAPPVDGTPVDYTGMENVSFMAYVLAHQKAYRSEAFTGVDTRVGFLSYRQEVETYKDCKNGVMIATDISKSSLVNTATQSCFIGDRVFWRDPASQKAKDWNGRNTRWAEDPPSGSSVEDYVTVYGLPSTDFSVYCLNAETLSAWSDVTDNKDGTYTQTVYPDAQTASAYYAVRMKTMGGLSDLPVFDSIEITYTFDASWRVLSSVTREHYGVTLGILRADNCSAVTTQNYYYDEASVDVSAFDTFFSRYTESPVLSKK